MFLPQVISWRLQLPAQLYSTSPLAPWPLPPRAMNWWCSSVWELPTCPSPTTCSTRALWSTKLWSNNSHSWWVSTASKSLHILSFFSCYFTRSSLAVLSNEGRKRQASDVAMAEGIQLKCGDGFRSNKQESFAVDTPDRYCHPAPWDLILKNFSLSSS